MDRLVVSFLATWRGSGNAWERRRGREKSEATRAVYADLLAGAERYGKSWGDLQRERLPERRRVAFTLGLSPRGVEPDADGLAWGCKRYLDALKPDRTVSTRHARTGRPTWRVEHGLGLLHDDSPQWVDVSYATSRSGDPPPGTLRVEVYR